MREMLVASMIEDELRCLPPSSRPQIILLDSDRWQRFIWEINTADCLVNSEVRYGYIAACEMAKKNGVPISKVFEIECPKSMIRFRRNPYIQGIRIIYKTTKRRVR